MEEHSSGTRPRRTYFPGPPACSVQRPVGPNLRGSKECRCRLPGAAAPPKALDNLSSKVPIYLWSSAGLQFPGARQKCIPETLPPGPHPRRRCLPSLRKVPRRRPSGVCVSCVCVCVCVCACACVFRACPLCVACSSAPRGWGPTHPLPSACGIRSNQNRQPNAPKFN